MNHNSDLFIPCSREFLRSLMGEMGVVSGEMSVSGETGVASDIVVDIRAAVV